MPEDARVCDTGVVREVRTTGGGPDRTVEYGIEMMEGETCASCETSAGCKSAGTLIWARSTTALKVNQPVKVDLKPAAVLKATGWMFGIPLGALVVGILTGNLLLFASMAEGPRVGLSTVVGIGSAVGAGWLVSRRDRRISNSLTAWARPDSRARE